MNEDKDSGILRTANTHIHCCSSIHPMILEMRRILNEKHGVIPCLDEYTQVFADYIMNNVNESARQEGKVLRIDTNIFKDIEGCFFSEVEIEVGVQLTLVDRRVEGKVDLSQSEVNEHGLLDKFKCAFLFITSELDFYERIRTMFAHEITHAYEDWMRIKNHAESIDAYSKRINYDTNIRLRDSEDEIIRKMSEIIYHLTRFEINAYQAMIYEHLNIESFETVNEAFNYIKKTQLYQIYVTYGEWIDEFAEEQNLWNRELIARAYEKAKGLDDYSRTYEGVIRSLKTQYNKKWWKFRLTVGKMIADHVMNNNRMIN